MHLIFAGLILGIAVVLFFVWANSQTKKRHAVFTRDDVVAAIENVLSGNMHDEWDLFLRWPISDPNLESVRQRCIAISEEYSGVEPGKDIGTRGEEKLKIILDELQHA